MKPIARMILVTSLALVAVVLGIYPADRTVWCVEMVWAVGLWAILLLTRRKFRFSTPAYLCFFVWTVFCDTLGAICSSGLFLWCDRRDSLYWAPKVHGVAVLNPENDAPTAIWMRSRMKHQWIWDIVGVALIMSVILEIIGLLWLCAIGIRNLESRFLWAGTSRAIPQIDGTNLPRCKF